MRYDSEHKERTRARVVKEAAKAIRAEGPHRAGVAGIMAKAGLTHGGFYAHFVSKDDLVVAAMSQMFDEASVKFDRLTAGRCGPISTSTCLGSIATLAIRAVHIV